MLRDDILETLSRHRPEFNAMGVRRLAVFGSVARGEDRPDSDVDILVEFDRPVGLFEFLDVKELLEALLGRSVDLATPEALRPQMRGRILSEVVYAA